MHQFQLNKMNSVEELFEDFNTDTRKKLNRSDKQISERTLRVIEQDGITSEMLENLDVPVFKYKTQITIHGHFDEPNHGYLGGYKWLIHNKNGSLGVKYNAIDYQKKARIYGALGHVGWKVRKTTNEFYAYKTGEIASTKEEAVENAKDLIEHVKDMDTSFFIGGATAELLHANFIGWVVVVRLHINSIFSEDVDRLIEEASGKTIQEIEAIETQKKREKEQRDKERQERWDRQEKLAKEREQELAEKIENDPRFEKVDSAMEDGYFFMIDVGTFSHDTDYPLKVVRLHKKGRQKIYRESTSSCKNIEEVVETINDDKINTMFGSKRRKELTNVYKLA